MTKPEPLFYETPLPLPSSSSYLSSYADASSNPHSLPPLQASASLFNYPPSLENNNFYPKVGGTPALFQHVTQAANLATATNNVPLIGNIPPTYQGAGCQESWQGLPLPEYGLQQQQPPQPQPSLLQSSYVSRLNQLVESAQSWADQMPTPPSSPQTPSLSLDGNPPKEKKKRRKDGFPTPKPTTNNPPGKRQIRRQQDIDQSIALTRDAVRLLENELVEYVRTVTSYPMVDSTVLADHLPPGVHPTAASLKVDKSPVAPFVFYRSMEAKLDLILQQHLTRLSKLAKNFHSKYRNRIVNNRRQHLTKRIDRTEMPKTNFEVALEQNPQETVEAEKRIQPLVERKTKKKEHNKKGDVL